MEGRSDLNVVSGNCVIGSQVIGNQVIGGRVISPCPMKAPGREVTMAELGISGSFSIP